MRYNSVKVVNGDIDNDLNVNDGIDNDNKDIVDVGVTFDDSKTELCVAVSEAEKKVPPVPEKIEHQKSIGVKNEKRHFLDQDINNCSLAEDPKNKMRRVISEEVKEDLLSEDPKHKIQCVVAQDINNSALSKGPKYKIRRIVTQNINDSALSKGPKHKMRRIVTQNINDSALSKGPKHKMRRIVTQNINDCPLSEVSKNEERCVVSPKIKEDLPSEGLKRKIQCVVVPDINDGPLSEESKNEVRSVISPKIKEDLPSEDPKHKIQCVVAQDINDSALSKIPKYKVRRIITQDINDCALSEESKNEVRSVVSQKIKEDLPSEDLKRKMQCVVVPDIDDGALFEGPKNKMRYVIGQDINDGAEFDEMQDITHSTKNTQSVVSSKIGKENPSVQEKPQKIVVMSDSQCRKRPEKPNHILLFTIINPFYTITVDILYKICQPHGKVMRIVIFRKNGVQAMVEFADIESAMKARCNLNKADIFADCCTLNIYYARTHKLNVYKNDIHSAWDYTLNDFKEIKNSTTPLLPEPFFINQTRLNIPLLYESNKTKTTFGVSAGKTFKYSNAHNMHTTTMNEELTGQNIPVNISARGLGRSSVMMIYGLNNYPYNIDKLFNLICLYGNVLRIKVLKSKTGTAMVQMSDSYAVERCIKYLHNIPIGTKAKLQITFSNQNAISNVTNPFLLSDHTPSYKEFTGSKKNRFYIPLEAIKNRVQSPNKILHFFNAPPTFTKDDLLRILNLKKVPAKSVNIFPLGNARFSSGLIEYQSIGQATLAVMNCNHLPIETKGVKFPHIMKLCFSTSKVMFSSYGSSLSDEIIRLENITDEKKIAAHC